MDPRYRRLYGFGNDDGRAHDLFDRFLSWQGKAGAASGPALRPRPAVQAHAPRGPARLRTYLGRVDRDVGRKIAGNSALERRFARLLGLIERLLSQARTSRPKLYSLHAPEVQCFNRGKANGRYEFGAKVGIASTNREGFILAARAFEGAPDYGHTLQATLDQAVRASGTEPVRIYVDRGYRGHDYPGTGEVMIAGRRRGFTPTMRRELRRRSALEATIGHTKADHRMDRNFLLHTIGDAINALAAACRHTVRRIRLLHALILIALTRPTANPDTAGLAKPAPWAIGRSRGGRTTKIHVVVDGQGRPLTFTLTPGQRGDAPLAPVLIQALPAARLCIADTACGSDALCRLLIARGTLPVIPNNPTRKRLHPFDPVAYRLRNLIERTFCRLKAWRRIATRYDKLARNYAAAISIAIAVTWWI